MYKKRIKFEENVFKTNKMYIKRINIEKMYIKRIKIEENVYKTNKNQGKCI